MKSLVKMLQEFKDQKIVQKELEIIFSLAKQINRELRIMEVCGTHTMQISKYGIRKLMPKNVKLISGPGCPVCVTPIEYIDKAVYIVNNYDKVVLTTFGDLFRVPGSKSSLEKEKSAGKDIRIIYSLDEIINIAETNKDKNVIFLSIGFETTIPSVACIVKEIEEKNIENIYFLLGNKFFLSALEVLILQSRNFLSSKINTDSSINGFILPGHLSTIIGEKSYIWIAEKYHIPGVITGFEPVDIVRGIRMILEMIYKKHPEIKNEYTRVVTYEGNSLAKKIMMEVFKPDTGKWRGIGVVPYTAAKFNKKYEKYDAEVKFNLPKIDDAQEYKGCRCSEVLVGKASPFECPLFATVCSPEQPKGACMVSSEGVCAAYYKYEMC